MIPIDKHHGGYFKVFKMRGGKLSRIGTADEDLNIINPKRSLGLI